MPSDSTGTTQSSGNIQPELLDRTPHNLYLEYPVLFQLSEKLSCWQRPTSDWVRASIDCGRRGVMCFVDPAGGYFFIPRVREEGWGPRGIRSGWGQGAKREQGANRFLSARVLTNEMS